MKKIAIFISGTGSNAKNIIEYFNNKKVASVNLIISSFAFSPLLSFARKRNIKVKIVNKKDFNKSNFILEMLNDFDLLVLAGFLWLIPDEIIRRFPYKIINIHPALLP